MPVENSICLQTLHPCNRRTQRVAPVVDHRGSLLSPAQPIRTAAELQEAKCVILHYVNCATHFKSQTKQKQKEGEKKNLTNVATYRQQRVLPALS